MADTGVGAVNRTGSEPVTPRRDGAQQSPVQGYRVAVHTAGFAAEVLVLVRAERDDLPRPTHVRLTLGSSVQDRARSDEAQDDGVERLAVELEIEAELEVVECHGAQLGAVHVDSRSGGT
ncbi:MAG: hypothetical protein PGN37_06040 [Mycobacterium kyogaense]|uniref:hypothetical protein n=1 Tax=Mycobacterium kyogaense TaxID=2212479 RepID=UPI002FF8AD0A